MLCYFNPWIKIDLDIFILTSVALRDSHSLAALKNLWYAAMIMLEFSASIDLFKYKLKQYKNLELSPNKVSFFNRYKKKYTWSLFDISRIHEEMQPPDTSNKTFLLDHLSQNHHPWRHCMKTFHILNQAIVHEATSVIARNSIPII